MCGRFDVHSATEIIARIFGIDEAHIEITPNYNVAPSQDLAHPRPHAGHHAAGCPCPMARRRLHRQGSAARNLTTLPLPGAGALPGHAEDELPGP